MPRDTPRDKIANDRRQRATRSITKFIADERTAGRRRPNRRRMEARVRAEIGLTRAEVNSVFVDLYDQLALLGVLNVRRLRVRGTGGGAGSRGSVASRRPINGPG